MRISCSMGKLGRRRSGGHQFKANPVRVEEVDRIEPTVVDNPDYFDFLGFEPSLRVEERTTARDAKRDVMYPWGCGGIRDWAPTVEEIEEGQVRAVLKLKEDVTIRVVFVGAGHPIVYHGHSQGQTEEILVEVAGLFPVPTPVGVVVQPLKGREFGGHGTGSDGDGNVSGEHPQRSLLDTPTENALRVDPDDLRSLVGFERRSKSQDLGPSPHLDPSDLPRIEGLDVVDDKGNPTIGADVPVFERPVHHHSADVDPTAVGLDEVGHRVVRETSCGRDRRQTSEAL